MAYAQYCALCHFRRNILRVRPAEALDCRHTEPLNGAWPLSCTSAERYPVVMSMEFPGLVNLSAPDLLPDLSGIFCYELTFDRPRQGPACWKLAEVMANSHVLPKMVALPYLAELPDGCYRRNPTASSSR